jgi:hypothetical protein
VIVFNGNAPSTIALADTPNSHGYIIANAIGSSGFNP